LDDSKEGDSEGEDS
jgi:hypothetical protein